MYLITQVGRGSSTYLIVTLLVVVAYLPTFSGGFILDDNPLIKRNDYIKESHTISSYLAQEDGVSERRDLGAFHTGYYRPLVNITYRLDYKIWGMKAPGFRTTNLLLHLLTCSCLFRLLSVVFDDRRSASWATFLFALHPVNTESVSWIISRNNILVTLFSLSSLYFYIIGWEKKSYLSWILSLVFFICAICSKEFGLMVLPIFFLYHRFLSREKRDLISEGISYIPFLFVVALYFLLRKNVTGAFLTPFAGVEFWPRIYFVPFLILWNLRLIFLPHGLHFFYVTYPSSFFHWQSILSSGMLFLIVAALIKKRANKLLLFVVLSFFVLIFPVLNVVPSASTLATLVAMRWLYLPMAFISFGAGWMIKQALARRHALTLSLLMIITSYFGVYTYLMNEGLWHDEYTFMAQEVRGFHNDFLAGDLAEKLLERKDYQAAEELFKVAIEKYPGQVNYFINYSALLIETGRPGAALSCLNRMKQSPLTHHVRGEWFNNRGMALYRLGEKDEALKNFKKAVIFTPEEPRFWANLGGVYGLMGDYQNSVAVSEKGLRISPESVPLRVNLAKAYISLNDYRNAVLTLERISADERKRTEDVSILLGLAREKLMMKPQ